MVTCRSQALKHAEQDLRVLLDHFGATFTALGGVEFAVLDEWNRLNRLVTRDDVLRVLPVAELHFRAHLHFQHNHFNLMLLTAFVQAAAMDAVLSECGLPRLLPCLRRESDNYKR